MGFGATPKAPPIDWAARDAQREQTKAAIKASEQALPRLAVDPYRVSPMGQQTASDVAAAERMARQNMATKKGIANSIKPTY